ncbi:MAG TPA: heavy metal transport/detoxification protein, partial [Bacillota bacterium]|nr:heavy metal transport/detoxification protein [Bacillota bacterium]
QPSIYGDDISKVPTEKLVSKALVDGKKQSVTFKGIGYELQPLIAVAGSGGKISLTFDLTDFDNAEGEYLIIDASTGKDVTTFTAEKGINEIEFSPKNIDGYAIVKDNYILGIIEVVDNLEAADIKEIREKYLP